MVAEVYQADRGDVTLGLGSLTELQPALLREQSQQAAIGSTVSDGVTNTLEGASGFDVSAHGGNLDAVQTQFTDGFAAFSAALSEENLAGVVSALVVLLAGRRALASGSGCNFRSLDLVSYSGIRL
jgi:hypothetical protein